MSDNLPHATHHRYLPHQGIITAANVIKAGGDSGGAGAKQEMFTQTPSSPFFLIPQKPKWPKPKAILNSRRKEKANFHIWEEVEVNVE